MRQTHFGSMDSLRLCLDFGETDQQAPWLARSLRSRVQQLPPRLRRAPPGLTTLCEARTMISLEPGVARGGYSSATLAATARPGSRSSRFFNLQPAAFYRAPTNTRFKAATATGASTRNHPGAMRPRSGRLAAGARRRSNQPIEAGSLSPRRAAPGELRPLLGGCRAFPLVACVSSGRVSDRRLSAGPARAPSQAPSLPWTSTSDH